MENTVKKRLDHATATDAIKTASKKTATDAIKTATAHQTSYKRYFFPTAEMKDYNVMIDGKNFF